MTDQPQPRPPLWRVMKDAEDEAVDACCADGIWGVPTKDVCANMIRAVAQYLLDHCPTYIDPDGNPAFRTGARLLEVLEEEAKRAETGE